MRLFRMPFWLIALPLLLAACVPSPTATPPRASPFPTLPPLPTETPVPTVTLTPTPSATFTLAPTEAPTPTTTATDTQTPLPPSPIPAPATPAERVPPLVQVFASEPSGSISAGQQVALGVMAADNQGVARVELYDEKRLYSASPPLSPAPRAFSTVIVWSTELTGVHHLRLIAYDASGNQSAPAELRYDVLNDNKRPTALITNYVGETNVELGAPLLLQGVATDEVAVSKVDLYVDDAFYTFVAAEDRQTPFAVNLMWVPDVAGDHRIYLRAHDNQDQTGDSPPLVVHVLAPQPPALLARYERDDVNVNGTLIVSGLGLSPNGVVRLELWADNQLVDQASSANPLGQTVLDVPLVWQAPNAAGDHSLLVRAFDRVGATSDSALHVIHVLAAGTRLATPTPAPPLDTPTPTAPNPTATPEILIPPPPTLILATVQDPLAIQLPGTVGIRISVRGNVELEHVDLWGFYQGETTPQLLLTESLRGSTDKTVAFDWTPPRVGVVFFFAEVFDRLGQSAKSDLLTAYLVSAPAPTATPIAFTLAPRWGASIPTGKFDASFVQIGRAVRGTLLNTPVAGTAAAGLITAGTATRDRVTFTAEFNGDASVRFLSFDCAYQASPLQLACNYQDDAGNRGSAVFIPTR